MDLKEYNPLTRKFKGIDTKQNTKNTTKYLKKYQNAYPGKNQKPPKIA
jgi:hypothetical protein